MGLTRDAFFWNALQEHAQRSAKAAALLDDMLLARASAETLAKEISTLEKEGDKIVHETIAALHQTWITPLDREEIFALLNKLDDILDSLEEASQRFLLYRITDVLPEAIELSNILRQQTIEVQTIATQLQAVHQPDILFALCKKISQLESETNAVMRRAIAQLFNDGHSPLTVIKWRDIFEAMATAADRAEDVANIVEGIVLEHA